MFELGAHLNHAGERIILINPLVVGKDGITAQALVVVLVEFQDGIVLRSAILNTTLHHGVVKVNIGIVTTQIAIELLLEAPADSVHHAVRQTSNSGA